MEVLEPIRVLAHASTDPGTLATSLGTVACAPDQGTRAMDDSGKAGMHKRSSTRNQSA